MEKRGSCFWDLLPIILVISVVCSSLFFVNFTGMAVSCTDGDGDGFCVSCSEVASNPNTDTNPKINLASSGRFLAYESKGSISNIFLYDLNANTNSLISRGTNPAVNENNIAWVYKFNLQNTSIAYKPFSGNIEYLASSLVAKMNPTISDAFIIWQAVNIVKGAGFTDSNLVVYNLLTKQINVMDLEGNQAFPDIEGAKIVYQNKPSDASDIDIHYIADILNPNPVVLYNANGDLLYPKISGDYVVWQSMESGNSDIYAYKLSTGERIPISTNPSVEERYPDINNGKVVWSDNLEGGWNIRLYDFNTGEKYNITNGLASNNVEPTISGDYVSWLAGTSRLQSFYLGNLNSCTSLDCDDNDDDVYTGASEICDSKDNNCDGQIDEGCTFDTLTNDTTTNLTSDAILENCFVNMYLYDSTWTVEVTELTSFDIFSPILLSDLTCLERPVTFDIYNVIVDETSGSFTKDAFISSLDAIYNYGYDETNTLVEFYYADADLSSLALTDGYYIITANDGTNTMDSGIFLVCADLMMCDFGNEEEIIEETPETILDCASEWDCSNVEWTDCDPSTNMKYRDLTLCNILPAIEECLAEEYWPEYQAECIPTENEYVDDTYETPQYRATSEVPVFTWLNLLMVISVLTGFYFMKWN